MNGDQPLLLSIRESTWGASLLVLVLIAVAHIGLRSYTKYKCRKQKEAAAAGETKQDESIRHWLTTTLLELIAPVALLLWIHGLHYACTILLADITQPWVARYALPALDAARGVGTILALMWLLARVGRAIESRLVIFARHSRTRSDDFLLPIAGTAVRLLLPLVAIILGSSMLPVPPRLESLFRNGVSIVLIVAIGHVLYRMVEAVSELVLERFRIDVADNREARAVHTQVSVLRKVAASAIVLFAFAGVLMVFDEVRQVGATMLASAGVAGIVIGFAAQRSLGMLLAGFQIALTQPIRIDDVVIVEGEWGKIEEITLTYVVVAIWDQRRHIVPITFFLEKPFQNWTRTTVELLATVELYVDYNFPIEALREKLTNLLNASKLWDKRANVLQVTDAKEHTVQIRALMSAANAGAAFDLRCEVREGLLRFLQQEHPEGLPRMRLTRAEQGKSGVGPEPTSAGPAA